MANTLGGFEPARMIDGSPYSAQLKEFVATGNLYVGDMVTLVAGGAVNTVGIPSAELPLKQVGVATNAATQAVIGVVVGFGPNPLNLNTVTGTTAPIVAGQNVYVEIGPRVVYAAKLSGVGAFSAASIGLNTVINTSVAGANGRSNMSVDAAFANGAAAPLKVIGIDRSPDNSLLGSPVGAGGTVLEVIINNYQWAPATGLAGV